MCRIGQDERSKKYAGKVDIARNVNSVLIVGGNNKSVQQMDCTTNRSELMKEQHGRPRRDSVRDEVVPGK